MNASDTTKHDAGDEISLRDLYLILKRNVWWVAGAALSCAKRSPIRR